MCFGQQPCKGTRIECENMIEAPYPQSLLFNVVWQPVDMTQSNCLLVLASLPQYTFLSQMFVEPTHIKFAYKPNAIVAYTGAHYLVFIRVKHSTERVWTLYNDADSPKQFKGYGDVCQYFIESNCFPTLVVFERFKYS